MIANTALKGVRVLSLALNLPGPAALMRCRAMGARCTKIEPPPLGETTSGDPMALYCAAAYTQMHQGIRVKSLNLKADAGQKALHRELKKTDVLLTSFRPSALAKLGLDWKSLQQRYPDLSLIAVVGAPGARAEEPGHDLTYMAESDLLEGLALPRTLYADMGGSLMAAEAVLQARLLQLQKGKGVRLEVALAKAAAYLALPRTWGLTAPGAAVGGGHVGYGVYACKDGRVALAALEPHFAHRLLKAIGAIDANSSALFDMGILGQAATRTRIAKFLKTKTRAELEAWGHAQDIPLHGVA